MFVWERYCIIYILLNSWVIPAMHVGCIPWSRSCRWKFSLFAANKIILVGDFPLISYPGFSRPTIQITTNPMLLVFHYCIEHICGAACIRLSNSEPETYLWKCAPSRKFSPFISFVINKLKVSATRFKSNSLWIIINFENGK